MKSKAHPAIHQSAIVAAVASLACCLQSPLYGGDSPSPAQPYAARTTNPVTHDVELVVTVTAPYKTKALQVWMPIPLSDSVQEVVKSEITTFPVTVAPQIATEPVFGNKFAYFEFQNPQGAVVIRHTLRMKVSESGETKFSWMTAHRFESVPAVTNPFADISSLRE